MERERNTFFLSLDADTDTHHGFTVTCVAVSFYIEIEFKQDSNDIFQHDAQVINNNCS